MIAAFLWLREPRRYPETGLWYYNLESEFLQTSKFTAIDMRRKLEMVSVFAFVAISLVAPFVLGELYPFTVSPMFRDQPEKYCTYQVFDESGNELDLEKYGLHLVYDGNPPGLGMGIEARPTMHRFGEVPDLQTVADRVRQVEQMGKQPAKQIRLCQTVVACDGTRPKAELRETTIELPRLGAE